MRLAVLTDVHGNLHALEAVLEDIARQQVEGTVALGDFLSGPLDPVEVAERLMALNLPSVRGNHDRYLAEGRDKDWHVDAFVRGLLDERHLAWLRGLPATVVFDDRILLCHATPRDDVTSFLDGMVGEDSVLLAREHIEAQAAGVTQELILCGHTHVPRTVTLADGRMVVNPGSVGLPFDSGSPAARYAIVEKRRAGWAVQFMAVPYDTAAAAALAVRHGYPIWADVVTTGWPKPRDL